MADSVLQNILFWSIGYGSLMGLGYAPVLMLYTNSWVVRTIILGFSVPMGALLTTALSVSVYGYGVFMNIISGILIQPLFVHSMIHTMCLSGVFYSGYTLFLKEHEEIDLASDSEEESEKSEEESDNSDETDEESDNSDETDEESENSEEAVEGSENSEEAVEGSENSESSKNSEGSEKSEQGNEWRTTANFEGLRTAPPLPE